MRKTEHDQENPMKTANLARCTHHIQRLTCWPGPIARLVFETELARLQDRTQQAQQFIAQLKDHQHEM